MGNQLRQREGRSAPKVVAGPKGRATIRKDGFGRPSIVDLMKVLDFDSSLTARKQPAQELGYKSELNGSADMNTVAATNLSLPLSAVELF